MSDRRPLVIALSLSIAIHALFISSIPTWSSPQPAHLTERDIRFLFEQLAALSNSDESPGRDSREMNLPPPVSPEPPPPVSQDSPESSAPLVTEVSQSHEPEEPQATAPTPPPTQENDSATTEAPDELPDPDELARRLDSITARLSYFQVVHQRVQSHLIVPPEVRRREIAGTVLAQVTILRSGEIKDIVLLEPSEHEILNDAARKTIQSAAPFPSLEGVVDFESINVNIPFQFYEETPDDAR